MIRIHEQYTLPPGGAGAFYAKRSHEPTGQAPQVSFPQWNRCLWVRLRDDWFSMNRFKRSIQGDSIQFTPAAGRRLIEWELASGESVCFDTRKMVGFSDSISLHADISLRLTAFAMNRMTFTIARGPGILLLESLGMPEVITSPGELPTLPPSRLAAWSADSVFGIEIPGGWLQHYVSPVYLKIHETSGIVVDAPDPKSSSRGFLRKMIKQAYSPYG